jgi:hypothetical protein
MAHGLSSFTWKESILLAFSPKNVSLSLSLIFITRVAHPRTRLGVTTLALSLIFSLNFITRVAPHFIFSYFYY